jgi:hypothetical protein
MVEKATPEHETWENTGMSRVVLKKYSHSGELVDEMLNGRRKIMVTPHERRLNQELAANKHLDPFANGTLSPVHLIETADDLEEIKANPNLMSETDMKDLLKGHFKKLEARLAEIDSEPILNRLLEVASEEDASLSKVNAIKTRLDSFKPDYVTEVTV